MCAHLYMMAKLPDLEAGGLAPDEAKPLLAAAKNDRGRRRVSRGRPRGFETTPAISERMLAIGILGAIALVTLGASLALAMLAVGAIISSQTG